MGSQRYTKALNHGSTRSECESRESARNQITEIVWRHKGTVDGSRIEYLEINNNSNKMQCISQHKLSFCDQNQSRDQALGTKSYI